MDKFMYFWGLNKETVIKNYEYKKLYSRTREIGRAYYY